MEPKKTIMVGLVGGAGAGKSTLAARVFAMLKDQNIDCEMAREVYKEALWEQNLGMMTDELLIFALQNHALHRLKGKVDVVISDASLYQKLFYQPGAFSMKNLVKNVCNQYRNMTYVIHRVKPYNPNGRYQTEEQAKNDDTTMHKILIEHNIPFKVVTGDISGAKIVVKDIMKELGLVTD